jgi:heme-degrading monooxygenase HmoA
MYVAMNHFRIAAGRGAEFEQIWADRESFLDQVPGFIQFHLVRGKDHEDGAHAYASHVIWDNRQTFLDWTHSDAFKKAHGQKRGPEGLMLEHPRFHGWEAVELKKTAAAD